MTLPLAAYFQGSGVAAALKTGNSHLLIVGDSLTPSTVNARLPSGIVREWGVKTAPIAGVVCAPGPGPTDQWGRSFLGTSSVRGLTLKPGNGVLVEVSGGAGTFTWGEVVTESVSGATGFFVEEAGGLMRILYAPGDNVAFTGGQTLTGGTSGATRTGAAVSVATEDHLGLPRNIFPGPHTLMEATGNPAVSSQIFRSQTSNTNLYPQGDWTSGELIGVRGIYYSHPSAFNIKWRSYRNSVAVLSTNHNQQSAENAIKSFDQSCGNGAAVPCEGRWEALSGDETGQHTLYGGALIAAPNVALGVSLDSVSIGGDGIDAALDTSRCTDAHYAEYLGATRRPEADTLVVMIWYGQNNAAMSQLTFQARLQSVIDRFLGLNAEVHGYTHIKFILVASYNTGGAHLAGKRDACYAVTVANQERCAFLNLYDLYDAAYVAANTSDGIHPTLAFAQEIASDLADEIENPSADPPPPPPPSPAAPIVRVETPADRAQRPKRAVQVLKPVDTADAALVAPTPGGVPAGAVAVGSARRVLVLPVGAGNDGAPTYLVVGFARFGDATQYMPVVLAQGSAVLDSALPISQEMAEAISGGNLEGSLFADAVTPTGATNNRYSANHLEWGEHEPGANQIAGVLIDVGDFEYVLALTKRNTATSSGMLGLFS